MTKYIDAVKAIEAKIKRQEAEITRLLAESEKLKKDLEYYHTGTDICDMESARLAGQNEAWELARKIVLYGKDVYSGKELKEIFDCTHTQEIIRNHTYPEAAKKVAEWEKAKKEIKVGDVVRIHEGNDNDLCVLCMSTDKKYYNAVDGYGAVYYMLTKEMITPTGRHIDIDGFLKQIGGAE